MSRRGICAAGLMLLVLAGCTPGDFLGVGVSGQDGQNRVMFVGGIGLEGAIRESQTILESLGLKVTVKDGPGRAVLTCTTKSGARFNLVYTQQAGGIAFSSQGVHIELQGEPGDTTGVKFMLALEALNAPPAKK